MKSLMQYIKEEKENPFNEINGFVILKPEFLDKTDQFIDMLKNNGWQIIQRLKTKLSKEQASELYKMHKDKDFYKDLCEYMCSDDCLCCSCQKQCADPIKDMEKLKEKVRKSWGKSEMKNAMHSSDSMENVKRESKIVF